MRKLYLLNFFGTNIDITTDKNQNITTIKIANQSINELTSKIIEQCTHLTELTLIKSSLEKLEHPPPIQYLNILSYELDTLPEWISDLSNLIAFNFEPQHILRKTAFRKMPRWIQSLSADSNENEKNPIKRYIKYYYIIEKDIQTSQLKTPDAKISQNLENNSEMSKINTNPSEINTQSGRSLHEIPSDHYLEENFTSNQATFIKITDPKTNTAQTIQKQDFDNIFMLLPFIKNIKIDDLGHITELKIDYCNSSAQHVVQTLVNLKNIQILEITNSNLIEFPPLQTLTELTHLNLSSNHIDKIPDWIGRCEALKVMNLSRNNISEINPDIASLKNLTTLLLDRNKITHIPDFLIESMPHLKEIDLQFNRITIIPKSIIKIKEKINVDNNYELAFPPFIEDKYTQKDTIAVIEQILQFQKQVQQAFIKPKKNAFPGITHAMKQIIEHSKPIEHNKDLHNAFRMWYRFQQRKKLNTQKKEDK